MVRFRTVKIGGKQDYGVKGIQDLRMYMEELKVDRQIDRGRQIDRLIDIQYYRQIVVKIGGKQDYGVKEDTRSQNVYGRIKGKIDR